MTKISSLVDNNRNKILLTINIPCIKCTENIRHLVRITYTDTRANQTNFIVCLYDASGTAPMFEPASLSQSLSNCTKQIFSVNLLWCCSSVATRLVIAC